MDLGSEGILLLVSTGEDATGIPVSFSVLETFRVNFSPANPPDFGITLVLEPIGNELGILDPP